ncbi:MAG: hypothetical protein ABIR66_11485, partial [Saprospiraceae bacterium]
LAQINVLLTWTTTDITGFIHGKYNEYLAARKPILCLVEGKQDIELQSLYSPLDNSIILTNDATNKEKLTKFILYLYQQWKSDHSVPLINEESLKMYDWRLVGKPLLEILES